MTTGAQPITAVDLLPGGPATALLALNNAHARELSPLTAEQFHTMVAGSFAALRVGEADALLLAFDERADYASPNFRWFRERERRFVYVDRVVVAPGARRRGLAGCLYASLFARAEQAGHDLVVCEVNADPPNPQSDAFHAAWGFETVGHAALTGSAKRVNYLMRRLTAASA